MSKPASNTPKLSRPNPRHTRLAMRDAARELRTAAGIKPKPPTTRDGLSWAVALATGAVIALRGWQQAKAGETGADNQTANRARVTELRQERGAAASAPTTANSDVAAPDSAKTETAKTETGLKAWAMEFYQRFNDDTVTKEASALAFVGIFSLLPMMLFALIAFGFFFRDPAQASKYVQGFVTQLLPGEAASRAANDVIQQTHLVETAQHMAQGAILPLIVGVASLVWAGLSLLVTASTPMNAAWDVKETRSFVQLRLTCLALLLGAGLLFVLSIGLSAAPGVIAGLSNPLFGEAGYVPWFFRALFALSALVIESLMFVLIYRFLPNAPVTWRAALFGGVIIGIAYELFKQGFAYYLTHLGGSDNKLYGALGGIVLLVTWIYYGCVVLLTGAELAKMYHEHKEEGGVSKRAA